ncbi:MAG: carbonic anhydrase [Hyphomicrobiales bacterium]|nr:carbonic anhydrase [Hyphomicrobiales bacterium]MBV9518070.1 carbonic anhydrase [Hyphomicrobiales bacterium]
MCLVCDAENAAHRASRRGFFKSLGGAGAGFALLGGFTPSAFAKAEKAPPKPQNVVSPQGALDRLMAGNARYVEGVAKRHDFRHEREPLTKGQNPYAGILSCADSRIAPEYAFDSGRGDLFVCRVAGNFANDDVVASLEYAVAVLNTPLIMVLGHEACGAVDATINSLKDNTTLPGHLPSLVASLTPAVRASEHEPGDALANAIRQNVVFNVEKLKNAAPILKDQADQGKLRVVGATYKLAEGHVELVA